MGGGGGGGGGGKGEAKKPTHGNFSVSGNPMNSTEKLVAVEEKQFCL